VLTFTQNVEGVTRPASSKQASTVQPGLFH